MKYLLALLAFPVYAATPGTINLPAAKVTITLENAIDCADASMLVCVTTLAKQREYLLTVGSNAAFVTTTYRVLLQRPPTTAQATYYNNLLAANMITRDGVINEIVASAEYKALNP